MSRCEGKGSYDELMVQDMRQVDERADIMLAAHRTSIFLRLSPAWCSGAETPSCIRLGGFRSGRRRTTAQTGLSQTAPGSKLLRMRRSCLISYHRVDSIFDSCSYPTTLAEIDQLSVGMNKVSLKAESHRHMWSGVEKSQSRSAGWIRNRRQIQSC